MVLRSQIVQGPFIRLELGSANLFPVSIILYSLGYTHTYSTVLKLLNLSVITITKFTGLAPSNWDSLNFFTSFGFSKQYRKKKIRTIVLKNCSICTHKIELKPTAEKG